ncbi:hypothetical protein JCM10908_001900 [Rhodotorula pacifica]|uniref:uncharacterized protein n=1 Tax=Rhodotorula pacifica TaxID=1495444 RepID=UPI00317FBD61
MSRAKTGQTNPFQDQYRHFSTAKAQQTVWGRVYLLGYSICVLTMIEEDGTPYEAKEAEDWAHAFIREFRPQYLNFVLPLFGKDQQLVAYLHQFKQRLNLPDFLHDTAEDQSVWREIMRTLEMVPSIVLWGQEVRVSFFPKGESEFGAQLQAWSDDAKLCLQPFEFSGSYARLSQRVDKFHTCLFRTARQLGRTNLEVAVRLVESWPESEILKYVIVGFAHQHDGIEAMFTQIAQNPEKPFERYFQTNLPAPGSNVTPRYYHPFETTYYGSHHSGQSSNALGRAAPRKRNVPMGLRAARYYGLSPTM